MKVKTTRFGEIEAAEGDIFLFPEGLLGFPDIRSYVLLENKKGGPFRWLQSTEIPSLAFVVCDPAIFFPEYRVKVRAEDLASLDLSDVAAGIVLVILTVPGDPKEITANLQGPLVFNREKRMARQLVLSEPGLTTRHNLFKDVK